MKYKISHPTKIVSGLVSLPASKSISNRVLIIKKLCKGVFKINNLSQARDTKILSDILNSKSRNIDTKDAGTAMRFLTSFFALSEENIRISGNRRMIERPIKELVQALNHLGADISYEKKEGFPPIKIKKKKMLGGVVEINAEVSSQFISSLLLIGPSLKKGITIKMIGSIVSKPYILMTLKLMSHFGILYTWKKNIIQIKNQNYKPKDITIENDWSSACFWLEIAHLSKSADIDIYNLNKKTIQGDGAAEKMFNSLKYNYNSTGLNVTKKLSYNKIKKYDLKDTPDVSLPLIVSKSLQKESTFFYGLNTLPIKECNRLESLSMEMTKYGADVKIEKSSLKVFKKNISNSQSCIFNTYDDHRMAMSLAPLALVLDEVIINNIETVDKSYPQFWEELKKVGFKISLLTDLEK